MMSSNPMRSPSEDRRQADDETADLLTHQEPRPIPEAADSPIPMAEYPSPRHSEDSDMATPFTNFSRYSRPRWLSGSSSSKPWNRWWTRVKPTLTRTFRPRLTWRYIVCSILVFYVLVCWVIGSPILASRLPGYTGPYRVGAIDIEVPLPDGPKKVADGVFKDSGEPAFQVETVLTTIYYPTTQTFRSHKPRYPWVSKPISLTAKGYAKLAHVDNFLIRPIFTFGLWAIGGGITIPAEVDAPLLTSADQDREDSFPLMVFSHGMASSRSDYTNFLGELASRGHIVAALEHRDGSCPGSLVKLDSEEPGRNALYFRESDLKDEMDTAAFKRAQLAVRDAEILGAIELFRAINKGHDINNTRDKVTTLAGWEGRLDLARLTIGGHSYGATGALQALSTVAPPSTVGGLILDPGKSSGPLNHDAKVPLLIVHSNSWSKSKSMFHGRPHFDTVRDLVRNATSPSWFLTSIGTSHPSVTDAPLIEPLLLSWTTGARMNTKEALEEYVRVTDEFLAFVDEGQTKGLLAEKVTHEEYDVWVSEERKKEFPKELARLWQIHVTPDAQHKEDNASKISDDEKTLHG